MRNVITLVHWIWYPLGGFIHHHYYSIKINICWPTLWMTFAVNPSLDYNKIICSALWEEWTILYAEYNVIILFIVCDATNHPDSCELMGDHHISVCLKWDSNQTFLAGFTQPPTTGIASGEKKDGKKQGNWFFHFKMDGIMFTKEKIPFLKNVFLKGSFSLPVPISDLTKKRSCF